MIYVQQVFIVLPAQVVDQLLGFIFGEDVPGFVGGLEIVFLEALVEILTGAVGCVGWQQMDIGQKRGGGFDKGFGEVICKP